MQQITGEAHIIFINRELHSFTNEEFISSELSYQEFKNTKILNYFINKGLLSVEDALKFDLNKPSLEALNHGASVEDALKFKNFTQLDAYLEGVSIDQALNFKNVIQIQALKAGATPEQAINFTLNEQVYALRHGIPTKLALRVTDINQVWYLLEEKDMPIEEALAAGLKTSQGTIEPGTECLNLLLDGEDSNLVEACYAQYS